ncbi:MAG: hypothetical protein PVH82_06885 [Desulfobacteraceae bacterium]|jgi:hypothetical protein
MYGFSASGCYTFQTIEALGDGGDDVAIQLAESVLDDPNAKVRINASKKILLFQGRVEKKNNDR